MMKRHVRKYWHGLSVWIAVAIVGAGLAGMMGCTKGSASLKVAPVKGKLMANGQAVKGGSISFQPVEVAGTAAGTLGKPASGEVKEDGTFVLSTYGREDGAVVGKHRVSYMPVIKGAEKYGEKPTRSPYAGVLPKPDQVEVKSGPNDLTIELSRSK